MPRGSKQPRQGPRRKGKPGRIPLSIARQAVTVTVPIDLALPAGFSTVSIGRLQLNLIARYSALSSTFLDIKFHKVSILPVLTQAAQYMAVAVTGRHLPYDPNTADSIQPAPTSISAILARPRAKEWRQGNGVISRLTYSLRSYPKLRLQTFNTDAPSLFDVSSYSGIIATVTVFVTMTYSGVRVDV